MNWVLGRYSALFYSLLCTAGLGTANLLGFTSLSLTTALTTASILSALGLYDLFQKQSSVRANFPIIGRLRYFFESIRPELRQYFWEADDAELPYSRNQRAMVYQRAKSEFATRPFGSIESMYEGLFLAKSLHRPDRDRGG